MLSIQHLSYRNEKRLILSDINFDIHEGDFIAFIGPNGGGKTTLLKIILGLIHNYDGQLIKNLDQGKSLRTGYVPQRIESPEYFPAQVVDIVMMGRMASDRTDRKSQKKKALELLEILNLGSKCGDRFDQLSGGQKQRVLLARALLDNPDILLLDEPLSHVDPYGRQCILELLMNMRPKKTIIMVSHDLGITAHPITAITAVNKFAAYVSGNKPTDDMLRLMYGSHDDGCLNWSNSIHLHGSGCQTPE